MRRKIKVTSKRFPTENLESYLMGTLEWESPYETLTRLIVLLAETGVIRLDDLKENWGRADLNFVEDND